MNTLSVIIPCYNNALTIKSLITQTLRELTRLQIKGTIFVLDDASTDASLHIITQLAKTYPALCIISHKKNTGYGQTIRQLYSIPRTPWMISLPGDGQIPPTEIATLWKHRRSADMIIGWRKMRNDSPKRRMQSRIYNAILSHVFGISTHDINSIRLIKTALMRHIHLVSASAFVDAELYVRAMRHNATIIDVPITHVERKSGKGSGGSVAVIIPTIVDMIKFAVVPNI